MDQNGKIYGVITDIQRFSLHDGPGIRTSVFFKGCNLNCAWCHNPETISFEPEVIIDPKKCIGCGKCSEGCYSGARREVGKRYSVDGLMAEILQDKDYYGTAGGVTLTGGEVTCQAEFAYEVLKECKSAGIERAIETNLACGEETLVKLAGLCGLVMCDLKVWDDAVHEKYTGASNDRIKENIQILSGLGVPFAIRTTIVPGVNDTAGEIKSIARFLRGLPNLAFYELLSYNALGLSKKLEGKEDRAAFTRPAKEAMRVLAEAAAEEGLPARYDSIEIRR